MVDYISIVAHNLISVKIEEEMSQTFVWISINFSVNFLENKIN